MNGVAIRELHAGETHLGWLAMSALRKHLADDSEFVRRVDGVQRREGYRLVGAFDASDPQAAAAAGFHTVHSLSWGYALYCDDLSTRPEFRRRGFAGQLVDWMIDEARRLGCEAFHLDSGVGIDRQDAHRLYFNKRMRIFAYHFEVVLKDQR